MGLVIVLGRAVDSTCKLDRVIAVISTACICWVLLQGKQGCLDPAAQHDLKSRLEDCDLLMGKGQLSCAANTSCNCRG